MTIHRRTLDSSPNTLLRTSNLVYVSSIVYWVTVIMDAEGAFLKY